MLRQWLRYAGIALAAAAAAPLLATEALAQSEQQQLVTKAQTTLSNFLRDPDMSWLQKNIGRAKGVLIAPEVVKAGFIFGGSGGRAVLVAHEPGVPQWRGPAFYTLATASVGFQAGIQASENVTLVMTDKGLNTLLAPSVKLGGDASVAAGPVGAGASSDVTTDFVSFARAKGVYGGLNLDGTVISVSNEWNNAYYGKSVLPPDIVVRGSAHNKQADPLLAAVAKAGK
jgi:lipid-binding SYLF domain-containing protein